MFEKNTVAPLKVEISVLTGPDTLARAAVERRFLPSGNAVAREPVDEEGVTGALFLPSGPGPHPAVICLSGSGGGFNEPRASLLAARGYAAFALAYFGAGSLPAELFEIPLEFIERGLAWLGKHAAVDSTRVAVYGYSKGGELALLLASLYPQIKAAAAFSGSAFVWQGLHRGRPGSSWTRGGNPLPYLPLKMPLRLVIKLILGRNVAFRECYQRGLQSAKNINDASIRVEQIGGPIFLVAGTDDQVWPAADFSDTVAERLKARRCPYPLEYLREEGAGHLVGMPYLPSAEVCRNLVFTSSDSELTCLTMIRAWDALIDFLHESLVRPTGD